MRYRYYSDSKKRVYCVSTYAGRTVRACAVCSPHDTFNEEAGQALAKARVDTKIAEKRVKRAQAKYAYACELLKDAMSYVDKMQSYLNDSLEDLNDSQANEAALVTSY